VEKNRAIHTEFGLGHVNDDAAVELEVITSSLALAPSEDGNFFVYLYRSVVPETPLPDWEYTVVILRHGLAPAFGCDNL